MNTDQTAEQGPIPSHLRGEPVRTVRIADRLWTATTERAKHDGIPVSALIRDALDTYLDRRP